ncbi:hypothetical protein HC891_05030 [Candidatus Gracilibacteria bacterium]|nr:hypothetical protein [Candidatus Gracilibacteria bacterium]
MARNHPGCTAQFVSASNWCCGAMIRRPPSCSSSRQSRRAASSRTASGRAATVAGVAGTSSQSRSVWRPIGVAGVLKSSSSDAGPSKSRSPTSGGIVDESASRGGSSAQERERRAPPSALIAISVA